MPWFEAVIQTWTNLLMLNNNYVIMQHFGRQPRRRQHHNYLMTMVYQANINHHATLTAVSSFSVPLRTRRGRSANRKGTATGHACYTDLLVSSITEQPSLVSKQTPATLITKSWDLSLENNMSRSAYRSLSWSSNELSVKWSPIIHRVQVWAGSSAAPLWEHYVDWQTSCSEYRLWSTVLF